ncbi:MAG TPA: ECF transporter S component [Candidatus Aminicenantes bacterium]|nr:ECF transporter S component [Candidatus Aminicenantes bacterium]
MRSRLQALRITILSALSFILMLIEFPIPPFPLFLKMDFSDLPAIIAALSMGPLSGAAVELIKNVLHGILAGHTAFIGETANFLVGLSFVLTVSLVQGRSFSKSRAFCSGLAGTVVMALSAAILNFFLFLPLYEKVLGIPVESVIRMAASVNRFVTDKWSLILWSMVPFNLLKGIILTLILSLLYRKLGGFIKRAG